MPSPDWDWLSQILNSISVGAPQPGNILNSDARGPTLGHIGWRGYTPPGAPQNLPGATPPAPTGASSSNAGSWNWPVNSAQFGGDTGGVPIADSAAPQPAPNFVRPEAPIPRTYPMWPTPPAPAAASATAPGPPAASPAATPYATAMPWRGPIADKPAPASPAARSRSPFVQIQRPNMDMANTRRTGGGPLMMSALDLSRLFGRSANG